MKPRLHRLLIILLLALLAGLGVHARFGLAAEAPERKAEIVVSVTESIWWLTRWSDNQIECVIAVDHEGLPTYNEVYRACGETLFETWVATNSCEAVGDESLAIDTCEGLYLFLAGQQPAERTIVVELPPASVSLTLSGCTLHPPANRCDQLPELLFLGEEPLPNEQITAIHVSLGEDGAWGTFVCEAPTCNVPLPATPRSGIPVEFWAESSFGDTTEHFTAQVRALDAGVSADPGEGEWFVDVLSSQWVGGEIASCAGVWEAFPPPGGPPSWLSTPEELETLATDAPYVFLAGKLIMQGAVDASACPAGGLLENGTANACGLEAARSLVNEWQDRFDETILQVSWETNVPAQLLKNLFAVESQFWPGVLIPQEFGLGQMTALGADTTLLWNEDFFDEFCPLVLDEGVCAEGYLGLDEETQELLRGALTVRTDSTCDDCPLGLDLTHAEFSIEVFAETLLGNCEQAGRIVRNASGKAPGAVSTYQDLWRLTLVNYNAGPGCLSTAAKSAWTGDREITWETVAPRLNLTCPNAVSYVEQVAQEALDLVTPVPATEPTPTPTPTATAEAPYPAPGSQPTATPEASPYP